MWVLIVLIIVLAVLGLLGAYSLWVEPNWLRIRRRVILVDGWDPALDGLKILHLSDLHAGSAPSRIERFVRRAAEVPADFAVITGDFLSGPRGADDCARILSQLTARTEVYAVLGNHEHRYSSFHWPPIRTLRVWHPLDSARIAKTLEKCGIRMLVNSSITMTRGKASFVLAGVDDVTSPSFDLDKTLQDAGSGPAILLCHSPDILGEASRRGIPLVLSGHTHGGQVHFPLLGTPTTATVTPLERPSGEIRKGPTLIHINPGLGTTFLPIRLFARPEITLLELRTAPEAGES